MEHWQKAAEEAKKKKELQRKYPLLGRKVRRRGKGKQEEGIIILDNFKGQEEEMFIEFRPGDREQLIGLPFQVWDEETESWVEPPNRISFGGKYE